MTPSTTSSAQPVTTAEYLTWREDATAAHRARYCHRPPRRSATAASVLALEDQQTAEHYAAALLRGTDAAEQLFGGRGRVLFLKRYLVPGRWTVRTNAVFFPTDGTDATVLRIRAAEPSYDGGGTFVPSEADLFALAYQRYTVRASGTSATRCILLVLNPGHRSDPDAPRLQEMFECHNLTHFIDEAPRTGTTSIAEVVAEEADRVSDFLQDSGAVSHPKPAPPSRPRSAGRVSTPANRAAIGRILGRVAND